MHKSGVIGHHTTTSGNQIHRIGQASTTAQVRYTHGAEATISSHTAAGLDRARVGGRKGRISAVFCFRQRPLCGRADPDAPLDRVFDWNGAPGRIGSQHHEFSVEGITYNSPPIPEPSAAMLFPAGGAFVAFAMARKRMLFG